MASTKNRCSKCMKTDGSISCDGCQKHFCRQHLSEHHKEILKQVDQINDECETFRQKLPEENDPSPLLTAIDEWEQESIEKIQSTAENARADVEKYAQQTLINLNAAVSRITGSIKANRDSTAMAEVNMKRWSEQLEGLQELMKQPFPVGLTKDDSPSSTVNMIKTTYNPPIPTATNAATYVMQVGVNDDSSNKLESHTSFLKNTETNVDDHFHRFAGHVKLSENGLVATCVGFSSICGMKLYTTGAHRIQFRINAKKNDGLFFGILSSTKQITARATELPSAYGWRDYTRTIINGSLHPKAYREKNIERGDLITLTIDCDNAEILLTHHDLKHKLRLSVNLNECPLPWKLLVSSFGGDTIAILK